ncbi:MAG: hypothetical protein COY80_01245 [Candidatus Pacebacteria bacterium CG_4_10_14_0_8_um_filter_42_14]|nr:MAG: hypothetical protein COY80_01245 [Candidatus Pacebacteria bacterium CG_4_10_14_0_8_um_filter_42_14]
MKEQLIFSGSESQTNHIARPLIKELSERGMTIAIAEGCSGGSVANALTIGGSTRVFRIGVVAYSSEAKLRLGVPSSIIEKYGEYSPETAAAMNRAILKPRKDDVAISVVGEIGSDVKDKWAYILVTGLNGESWGQYFHFKGERISIQSEIAEQCLSNAYAFITGNRVKLENHLYIATSNLMPLIEAATKNNAQSLVNLLQNLGLRISTIESCTGGAIIQALAQIHGATSVIDGGHIAYDEDAKQYFGVPLETMAYGAVYSEKVAIAMAESIQSKPNLITIATTGAMESRDTRPFHDDTPAGRVYIAISYKSKVFTYELNLIPKSREKMKAEVVNFIFEKLTLLIMSNELERSSADYSPYERKYV